MTKKLKDAQKLQKIVDHFEKQGADAQKKGEAKAFKKRAKKFAKVVPAIDPEVAMQLRHAQDAVNANKSPNPLADMAHALGKCFQCGVPFQAAELSRQAGYPKGQIFLCIICMSELHRIQAGDKTVNWSLPYAATELCEFAYNDLIKSIN